MKINDVNEQLFAIYCASGAAMSLLELLPMSDIVMEVQDIILFQNEIIEHLIKQKKTDPLILENFINHTNELIDECQRISESNQKNYQ